jgi:hypothetical protein
MAHRPPYPATGDDTSVGADRRPIPSYPGTPRWVIAFGIVALILVLMVVIMVFGGVGGHGPGRHKPAGGVGGQTTLVASWVHQR